MSSAVVKTPIGRLSFPFLFAKDDKGKYRCTIIFKSTDDLSEIEGIIDAACVKKFGAGKVPKKIKLPIHRNDACEDREGIRYGGYEEDEGRHIRCWTTRLPKVVGREKDPSTGRLIELTSDEVYAGCYVRASLTAYAGCHDEGGNYCSLILSNIQKVSEGTPLAGIITEPDADFADSDSLPSDVAAAVQ